MMRCGSAPLAIKTGCFKQGKYIPPEERVCTICLSGVDDEFHLMFNYDFYSDIGEELFNVASGLNTEFSVFSDID